MVETETSVGQARGDGSLGIPDPSGLEPHPASRFRGRGEYAIDDKGRLTLPPQIRKALVGGGNLVVLDGRAVIWDEPTYRDAVDELNRKVASLDLVASDVRTFLVNTHQVMPDTQGRIVIPASVRIEAGLSRDVVVQGAGRRIEILPVGDAALDSSLGVSDLVVDTLERAAF